MTEILLLFWRRLKAILYFMGPLTLLIFLGLFLWFSHLNKFDESLFQAERVYQHIAELASPAYEGRLAGTEGNRKAQDYVLSAFRELGLEPAGENNTYYQNFKSMIPIENSPAYFRVYDRTGKLVKEYKLHEHYRENLMTFGGGGTVQGRLMHLEHQVTEYKAGELKDQILLSDHLIDYSEQKYAVEAGAKAIIQTNYFSNNLRNPIRMSKGSSDLATHEGKQALIYSFDRVYYSHLVQYAQEGCTVGTRLDIGYQLLDTPNILGMLTGREKDSYIIIGAHLDHMGKDYNGLYYPGAVDNASGIGMMLELARVMKEQNILPQKTIIFAAWNTEEYGIRGSAHYVQHPLYPLERTQVINLDSMGAAGARELLLDSKGQLGTILRSRLTNYAKDLGLETKEDASGSGSDHQYFLQQGVPAVMISDNLWDDPNMFDIHTPKDGIERISKERLGEIGNILLSYLKHDIYGDNFPSYLNGNEYAILLLYTVVLAAIYLIFLLIKVNPQIKLGRITAEEIYYAPIFRVIVKTFFLFTSAAVILIALIVIANIPASFNWAVFEGRAYTNFSTYLISKSSILYLRNFWQEGLGSTLKDVDVALVVWSSFLQSLKLLLAALLFAAVVGISKGTWDSYYKKGRRQTGLFGTLFVLSLPDVLIVFLAQLGLGILYNLPAFTGLIQLETVRRFFVPFLCLSILPAAYIARITAALVQEELNKAYVKTARAKGLSNWGILVNHILLSVLNRVLESLPAVVTVLISNLLVVEYFFYYPGLAFNLLRYYQAHDTQTFIGLSLALGLLYVACVLIFQAASYLLNPWKRRKTS